jgi:hypothetical protein
MVGYLLRVIALNGHSEQAMVFSVRIRLRIQSVSNLPGAAFQRRARKIL